MKAGFIGVGQMGGPMATNLAAVYEVTAFCRTVEDRDALAGSPVTATDDLASIAEADIIFLCLPNADTVENVLFGSDSLVDALRAKTVVVDTGTTEYNTTLSIHDRLAARDIVFVDAPISGMRKRAEDGTLTMMCGGDYQQVVKLTPLLNTMASAVIYMGQAGSGQLTKLINQLLFDINAAALAEILPLAVKLGLDPEKVGDVVNSGTGRSYASEFFIPNILKGDFSQGYSMKNAYKDLISGAEISARQALPAPVLGAATSTYQKALLAGHGDKDKGGMIRVFEDLLGVEFRSAAIDKT